MIRYIINNNICNNIIKSNLYHSIGSSTAVRFYNRKSNKNEVIIKNRDRTNNNNKYNNKNKNNNNNNSKKYNSFRSGSEDRSIKKPSSGEPTNRNNKKYNSSSNINRRINNKKDNNEDEIEDSITESELQSELELESESASTSASASLYKKVGGISLKEINDQKREETTITQLAPILEIFKKRREDFAKLYIHRDFYESNKKEVVSILKHMAESKKYYKIIEGSQEEMVKISGTVHHGGIIAIVKKKYPISLEDLEIGQLKSRAYQTSKSKMHSFASHIQDQQLEKERLMETLGSAARPIIVFLDGVENPMNLGAIARTCVLFGVKHLIIHNRNNEYPHSLNPFSSEAYRSSRGALEHISISVVSEFQIANSFLKQFRANGWEIVSTTSKEEKTISLYSEGSNKVLGLKPLILVFGSETTGITKSIKKSSNHLLCIPGTGLVESLNVAQAASVVLAECWRIQGKTLDINKDRVEMIKSGKSPLEITPDLLGIEN